MVTRTNTPHPTQFYLRVGHRDSKNHRGSTKTIPVATTASSFHTDADSIMMLNVVAADEMAVSA